MIFETDESNKTEKLNQQSTLPSPTQPSDIELSDTVSFDETYSTDYKLADTDLLLDETTDISFEDTSDNFTDKSYLDEEILNKQKETKAETKDVEIIPPNIDKPTNENRKYFLALPIIGILSLAVFGGGIFGIVSWINYSENQSENNSIIENTNAEKTPAVTPTVEANINTTEVNSNTEITADTPVPDKPKENKPKPTVQPTSRPVIKQTPKPVATQRPKISRTPKPKPTKKVTADDLMNDN